MRAIRIHAFGGPEALEIEDLPDPEPGRGEVRLRIQAAGVNYIDIYQRSGAYAGDLPFIPGMEAAGIVDAVGPGVEDLRPGQAAAYCMQRGAYAEMALVPAWKVVPLPEGVDAERAAAALLQGMTAHYLSHSTFALERGHTAVVHAAAGGVGGLLVQMAKRRGARVVATVSSREKIGIAREAGADHVVLYEDCLETVKRISHGSGAHVVYDSVGKATFEASLQCLRPRGLLALYGQSSGAVPPLDAQVLNARGSLFLTRPSLAHYTQDRTELLWRSQDLFGWIRDGSLRLRLDSRFPLHEAGEAHRRLESRRSLGKILLTP